jgi:hypothetical protein
MTKTSRPRDPIESFGAEVFNALIEGSRREFRIPTTYREASLFRVRAHKLRKQMQLDAHPLYSVAARTKITIEWDENAVETIRTAKRVRLPKDTNSPVTLVIAPHDSQFTDALIRAGLGVKPQQPTSPESPPADSAPNSTSLDILLDLKR